MVEQGSELGDARIDVVVHDRIDEAEGIVSLALRRADGSPLPQWTPGAHVDLILASGLIRQYSLCGDLADRHQYRIAVLKDPNSRGGSIEIHDTVMEKHTVHIRAPRNHFALSAATEYLFVAGGIGITPILPMIHRAEAADIPWTLAYGGRSLASMAFLDEVRSTRCGTVHIIPEDRCGLPDLDRLLAGTSPEAEVYCCGPEAMLEAVQNRCAATIPARTVHLERFGAAPNVRPDQIDSEFIVELRRSRRQLKVPTNRTLLEVLRDLNPDIAFSCEEGYCGSCETRVLEGIPDHRDSLLSEQERQEGRSMLVCVSRSKTPRLALDL